MLFMYYVLLKLPVPHYLGVFKFTSCVPEYNARQLAAESARVYGGSADFWKVLQHFPYPGSSTYPHSSILQSGTILEHFSISPFSKEENLQHLESSTFQHLNISSTLKILQHFNIFNVEEAK